MGPEELLALGQTRRKLGQKQGDWTHEMNDKLMQKIGVNGQGNVSEDNFVTYFDHSLSKDRTAFDTTVAQFRECAVRYAQRMAVRKALQSSPPDSVQHKEVTDQEVDKDGGELEVQRALASQELTRVSQLSPQVCETFRIVSYARCTGRSSFWCARSCAVRRVQCMERWMRMWMYPSS